MLALRIAAVKVVLFLATAITSAVAWRGSSLPPPDPNLAAAMLLVVCALEAPVLSFIVLRSRWSGWRLAAAVFLVLFGVKTALSQIETAVFLPGLLSDLVPRIVFSGLITAALFSPLAVMILGRWRRVPDQQARPEIRFAPFSDAWLRVLLLAAIYVVLYFVFGALVAWRNPAVRAFYAQPGASLPGFGLVLPLEFGRGLLWVALGWLITRILRGPWWKTAPAVALAFAVLMNAGLLLPNSLMPREVRLIHLVETASSNFLFGWIVVWMLRTVRSSATAEVAR